MTRILSLAIVTAILAGASYAQDTDQRRSKWQSLPHGTAMPLGEFQEDLHIRKGLPLSRIACGANG